MQEKRKEVAAVTKSLQICKTYKPVWMQYVELPMSQKSVFYSGHSTELQAYSSAAKDLEKEGIDQSVDLDMSSICRNGSLSQCRIICVQTFPPQRTSSQFLYFNCCAKETLEILPKRGECENFVV